MQACTAPLSTPNVPDLVKASGQTSATRFGMAAGLVAVSAAALAGWAPLGLSIVAVFLFAGPHNWMEFRYFLSQMPARWGPLRNYFVIAILGALFLTAWFAFLPWMSLTFEWNTSTWGTYLSIWNSLFVLWIASLVHLRGRQKRGADFGWIWAPAFVLVAGLWLKPRAWDLALVYLHPLMALWFLERVLRRKRPEWLKAFHRSLLIVPLMLGLLWFQLAEAGPLPGGDDALTMRITRHAGASLLPELSPHLLVSTHVFLEVLHYGIWIIAIPLIGLQSLPWNVKQVPLYRRSKPWKWAVAGIVGGGVLLMLVLWGGFLADYALTRDIYFTVAMLHVLAEFPFLIRTL